MTVNGDTAFQFATVPTKETTMSEDALTLKQGETQSVEPDALGKEGNRFLIVKNTNPTAKGSFTIKLI